MSIQHSEQIHAPAERLWQWLSRPGAIHRLIPPWQPMTAVSEAASLRDGVARLKVAGVPWTAQHRADGYLEGRQFVDELVSLPLRLVTPWKHTHLVAPDGASGTMNGASRTMNGASCTTNDASCTMNDASCTMNDTVQTPVPEAVLRSTFVYRAAQLNGDLAAHADWSTTPLTVAMTGSSGLIGTQLRALLTTGGHRVIRLVRHPATGPDERRWDPQNPAENLLDGVDAVVHLAGEPISGRFTDAHKAAIRDSRVGPTRRLAETAAAAGVSTFVSASGIGYYGADRGEEMLAEDSVPGSDFLAQVVIDWEAEAALAAAGGTRVVQIRTGIVVTPKGGFLQLLRPLFAVGVGGRLGTGEQWLSWIGIDDLLDIYLQALADPSLRGPVNAVAPNPVRNSEFTRTFGHVLHRPTLIPVPSFGPKLLLGTEGAEALAEANQRVAAAALVAAGHRFRHPELEPALRHLMGKV